MGLRRRPRDHPALRGPAAEPRQRHRAPELRDEQLVLQPDDRPDRAVHQERRVREAGSTCFPSTSTRRSRGCTSTRSASSSRGSHAGAGRLHRCAGGGARTSPTTTATRSRTHSQMRAMVLAAGLGTRLRPLTYEITKPMVPVLDRPVMEHIIDLLEQHGFDEVIANLHYFPDSIRDYFGDRHRVPPTRRSCSAPPAACARARASSATSRSW